VSDALQLDAGDPLVVLFGSGVTDVFVGTDYQGRGLEESLWHNLRAAGFRRIVFSSVNSPLYVFDQESRDFVVRQTTGSSRARTPGKRSRVEAVPRQPGLTGLTEVKEHIDRLRWRTEAEARRRREGPSRPRTCPTPTGDTHEPAA
jgi:hypothetical protein